MMMKMMMEMMMFMMQMMILMRMPVLLLMTTQRAASPDPGSGPSRTHSPRAESEPDMEASDRSTPSQSVLDKLKQQVADVTGDMRSDVTGDRRSDVTGDRRGKLVPLPGLGLAGYGGSGGRASSSPPARDTVSPPVNSAAQSPRQGSANHASWNYEEQFKQLYEIDDNPMRKEFLDGLFQFMQDRGTPINRLPIMAKQVLDMYELYNLVVAQGGLVQVINKKLWQEIIKGLKLPSSITSAAFTLRTQYMKYLYPYECQKQGLSSPSELQVAIDGNRREGRRSTYNNASYADLMQRSPLMAGSMAQSFGLANGLPTTLQQSGL
ncbi:AT-rich interactive domain-containing protein 3A-like, partial [Pollicipes pollicipes]|uniref:AT-rich interactive domain-containing protein 3A-like n=1 Tax=Pollicipes pollicipes TaxID=41117 RepID=UPI001884EA68